MQASRHSVALFMGAIAATAMDKHMPVLKVSIVPCNTSLGFVRRGTRYDPDLVTNADREKELELSLAGHTAEGLFCDNVSTASAGDLQRAQHLVEAMQRNGDTRSSVEILTAARARVSSFLTSNEGNVRRIANALVRDGELSAQALQQVIGGA
jgi:cell division protease FtsH